jgi:hypothetical protein
MTRFVARSGNMSIAGSGLGLVVVLIAFLVIIFMGASAAGQAAAGSVFGLILLSFMVLFAFLLLGIGGRARMRW